MGIGRGGDGRITSFVMRKELIDSACEGGEDGRVRLRSQKKTREKVLMCDEIYYFNDAV